MKISYDAQTDRYLAQTRYEERHAIKRAGGWQWNPTIKQWWNGHAGGVVDFAGSCDESAALALRAHCATMIERLRASALSSIDFDVPAPEGCEYRPFQGAGVKYIDDTNGRTLLADQMGLGKTIQALGWINLRNPNRIVAVCPASIVPVWKMEARKWLVEDYSIRVLHGRAREVELVTGGFVAERTLTIVGYDNVAAWQKDYPEHFEGADLVILDECHRIKNAKAKRTAAVLDFARKAKHVIATTGTPIVNRPIELWNIVNLIDPDTFSNFFKFAKRYADGHQKTVPIKGKGLKQVWDFTGSSNLDELQEKLRTSCMIRRLKSQVLAELPPKQYTVVEVKGSKAAQKIEDELLAGVDRTDPEAMAAALRAIGGDPEKFDKVSRMREQSGIAKLPAIRDYLDLILETEESLIVFAHHKAVLDGIRKHCTEAGYGVAGIDGDTPDTKRESEVARFQAGEVRVFLGGVTAAGEGITLHRAHTVLQTEMDWRPGIMEQADDRAHRIGQEDVVDCHYLVAGGIEGYMAGVVADKAAIITRALDSDMTQDDDPAIARLNNTIASIDKRLGELRKPTPAKQAKDRTERAEPELSLDVIPF